MCRRLKSKREPNQLVRELFPRHFFQPPGPSCSKMRQDNPGLVRNENSEMKAIKVMSNSFRVQLDDWML